MEPPVLTDEGSGASAAAVTLRPLHPGDADDLLSLATDPVHLRWCHETPDDLDRDGVLARIDAARAAWAHERAYVLGITSGERCAGVVRLEPDGHGGGRFALALAPWARSKHIAACAGRLALVWAFAQVGVQVVHWTGEVGDWPARRLAWACGFTVEGTVRELLPARDGGRRDGWVASLRWGDLLRPRSRWLDPVPLADDHLVLGPHVAADVERVTQACAAASTQEWLPGLPSPYTMLDAAAWIGGHRFQQADGTGVSWAVRAGGGPVDADGPGPLLATVGLFHVSEGARSAEVGYWCHPDARARGVTSAAVRLVARHALTPVRAGGLGLQRLDLKAAVTNVASRAVAERAGFREVGIEREGEHLRDGRRVDFVRFDLLAREVA